MGDSYHTGGLSVSSSFDPRKLINLEYGSVFFCIESIKEKILQSRVMRQPPRGSHSHINWSNTSL